MDHESWFRVKVVVPHDAPTGEGSDRELEAELVADVLWQCDPPAVEQRDSDRVTVLLAAFDSLTAAERARDAVAAMGVEATVEPVEDDGLDAWRTHARPHSAGPFTVVAPWVPTGPLEGRRLEIDPGRTFGSGSHPTSRLVLTELASMDLSASTVLDVGCGSGILSVAAALLGATRVKGVDVDPESPATTIANAERNGVAGLLDASNEPVEELARRGDRYDVVVANLLAPILVDLAESLQAVTRPGGSLVVSGLLADRWETTIDVLTAGSDLTPRPPRIEEDWVAVRLDRLTAPDTTATLRS
ncbi:MAG: 50S ribosomal protein L11 methyltransferase [Acidimicrobiales bacterium]|nr:50S ribosomal protein L11 methyltransferase [Acidimicrobiales bacterium]